MLLSSTGVLIRNFFPELEMQVSAEIILKYLLASTGMLQRNFLPELDMQVSAEVVLKHFLVRIGMLPRTFCLNGQALMAWDPILAIQDLLLVLEWCIAATLIPEHHPSDTQYLNPTNPRSPSPGSTPDSPGSTPDRIHS